MDTRALDTDRRKARRPGSAAAARCSPAVPVGPAAAASPATPEVRSVMSSDTYEAKVELLVNARRAEHGLRLVHSESCADMTAERWAERVASTGTSCTAAPSSMPAGCPTPGRPWAAAASAPGLWCGAG